MSAGLGLLDSPGWWRRRSEEARGAVGQPGARLPYLATQLLLFIVVIAPQELVPALAPYRVAMLTIAVAVSAHAWDRFRRRATLVALPYELGIIAALVAWAVTTMPLSIWPGGSVDFLLDVYLKTVVMYWLLAATLDTWPRVLTATRLLTLLGVPLAFTAVDNYTSGAFYEGYTGVDRIVGYEGGFAANPNDLALVLNLLLPMALALLGQARGPGLQLLLAAIAALYVAGVVVSFSRGGFVTLAAILVLYLIGFARRGRWGAVAALLLLAAAASAAFPDSYLRRLATITEVEADPTGSSQARWRDTLAAVRSLEERPLTGTGLGMNILALNEERGEAWTAVHNAYLELAVELGLPGLALFLWLYLGTLAALGRVARGGDPRDPNELQGLARALRISLFAFGVAALFHPVAYTFYFYLVAGLAAALRSVYDRRAGAAESPSDAAASPPRAWWSREPGRSAA